MGDRKTPVRVGTGIVALNFTLNLTLIWFLAERGLAVATSVAAIVQAFLLITIFSRRGRPIEYAAIGRTVLCAVVGSVLMWWIGSSLLGQLPHEPILTWKFLRVAIPVAASVAVYVGVFAAARGPELGWVLKGKV